MKRKKLDNASHAMALILKSPNVDWQLHNMRNEARAWANRFPSDPFAYNRAFKNLLLGLPVEA